jgi:hypothetical protein
LAVGFGFAPPSFPLGTSFFALSILEFGRTFPLLSTSCPLFHSFLKYQFEFVRQENQNILYDSFANSASFSLTSLLLSSVSLYSLLAR